MSAALKGEFPMPIWNGSNLWLIWLPQYGRRISIVCIFTDSEILQRLGSECISSVSQPQSDSSNSPKPDSIDATDSLCSGEAQPEANGADNDSNRQDADPVCKLTQAESEGLLPQVDITLLHLLRLY